MGRSPCCSKDGLNRGAWTALEDKILTSYIKSYGEGKWRNLPKRAGLKRCGKSCRLRWLNYLRPDIKRGNISDDEEELIVRLHKLLGKRWSLIAGRLPGRTDNEIKNYWNTTLAKKVHSQLSQHQPKQTSASKPKEKFPATEKEPLITPAPLRQQEPNLIIRTKASRCTEVLIPSKDPYLTLPPQDMVMGNIANPSDEFKMAAVTGDDHPIETSFFQCVGDYVNEDHEEGGVMVKVDSSQSLSAGSSNEDDLIFNESVLDDWLEFDCFEPNVASDLPSLASFLGLEEEWLP